MKVMINFLEYFIWFGLGALASSIFWVIAIKNSPIIKNFKDLTKTKK